MPPEAGQLWFYPTQSGINSSPAVGPDGTLYFGGQAPENRLFALNPDGTPKWTFPTNPGTASFNSSPAIGPDGTIYIGCNNSFLYAINPNGTQKWFYDSGGQIFSSPAVGPDGTVYFTTVDDLKLYALTPGASSAIPKWIRTTGNTMYSSPSIGPDGTI